MKHSLSLFFFKANAKDYFFAKDFENSSNLVLSVLLNLIK
jgi:hypothetical protein